MADGTVCRKARADVVGVRGPCEVRLVAGIARRWRRRVIVVGVALRTSQSRVNSSQRIIGIKSVIECDGCPCSRIVTGVAGGGERCRNVVGIGGPCEIRLMTAVTCRRQCRVVVVHVARCTWNVHVRSG